MEQKEQQLNMPRINVYNDNGYVYGCFGDYPLRDSMLDERLRWLKGYNGPKIKDISFGPFINFEEIKDFKTARSVDDFLVIYKENKDTITIYDQITLDNHPRKINWFDCDDKQQPIVFEPRLILYGVPKVVR